MLYMLFIDQNTHKNKKTHQQQHNAYNYMHTHTYTADDLLSFYIFHAHSQFINIFNTKKNRSNDSGLRWFCVSVCVCAIFGDQCQKCAIIQKGSINCENNYLCTCLLCLFRCSFGLTAVDTFVQFTHTDSFGLHCLLEVCNFQPEFIWLHFMAIETEVAIKILLSTFKSAILQKRHESASTMNLQPCCAFALRIDKM